MREIVLHRPLNPTLRVERLVQLNPSLSFRTLHNGIAGGRHASLQLWQGSRKALALVKRDLLGETVEVVEESRDGLLLFSVERTGQALDVAGAIERALGPETVASQETGAAGTTWRILTRVDARVPGFLREVREMEDAFEKREGTAIPRFALKARTDAAGFAPPRLLSPLERSVLAQADKLGYFDQPRKNGIAAVGKALRMPPSTALYHLRAAQRKLVKDALRA
jgi:predicted DNA binding protein